MLTRKSIAQPQRPCFDRKAKVRRGNLVGGALKNSSLVFAVLSMLFLSTVAPKASAQNLNGAGSSWGGSWNFKSSSSIAAENQAADMIARARGGFYSSFGPASSVVNNTTINDNRSNYVEANSSGEAVLDVTQRTGDDIGSVSNVTGAINTGSTTITVDGTGNEITAINSSDSQGCFDGSINATTMENGVLDPNSSASVLNAAAGFGFPVSVASSATTGGRQTDCVSR